MATTDGKTFCDYCHIQFGLAEERIFYDGATYHEDCDKARKRKERLRELLIRHALNNGLTITPHGIRGR